MLLGIVMVLLQPVNGQSTFVYTEPSGICTDAGGGGDFNVASCWAFALTNTPVSFYYAPTSQLTGSGPDGMGAIDSQVTDTYITASSQLYWYYAGISGSAGCYGYPDGSETC